MNRFRFILFVLPLLVLAQSACSMFLGDDCRGLEGPPFVSGTYLSTSSEAVLELDTSERTFTHSYMNADGQMIVEQGNYIVDE